MRFTFAHVSCALLTLAYAFRDVACAESAHGGLLPLGSTNQVHFLSDNVTTSNYTVNAVARDVWIDSALRAGLWDRDPFKTVAGTLNMPPLVRDHFIELQYLRNLYADPRHLAMSVQSFYTVVGYVNGVDNVFKINSAANLSKAQKSISTWLADRDMRAYLCSTFVNNRMHVYEAVQKLYRDIRGDPDAAVRAFGDDMAARLLNLNGFRCP